MMAIVVFERCVYERQTVEVPTIVEPHGEVTYSIDDAEDELTEGGWVRVRSDDPEILWREA